MGLKDKKVLVTGSSGFVGKHLVEGLKGKNADVVTFDVLAGRNAAKWGDFESVPRVDVVFHLAAVVFVPTSHHNPALTYRTNILGTLNALEFCRSIGAKMIFASSYVYGNPKYVPVDEEHPLNPTNPYARSKVFGETLCKAYHEDYGVRCVVLRPFNIYGEGQSKDFLIPEIIDQIKTKTEVTLKDLTPKRDFLYISDTIDAYIKAGEYERSGFEVFNIGSGKSYSVREIAQKLVEFSGKDLQVKSRDEKRSGEISDTVADTKKAKKLLGWEPTVDIDTGLKSTLMSR